MTTLSTTAKASRSPLPTGVEVLGEITPAFSEILTPEALAFVAKLQRQFGARRKQCLEHRQERQTRLHQGEGLDFLPGTKQIREANWKCAPIPSDIQDRRVEITGPTDRKMVINALNSGAKIFMADFEDANAPTWKNMVEGQINLRDAIRRSIRFTNPDGKEYRLNEQLAVLMPRPRGWHLLEKHVLVDCKPVSGGLFDFGLYFFHNAKELLARGSGPYFYLPKMESHLEARIWNDAFVLTQDELGLPQGTIRATVLIETIPAAFEMDEMLYELRDHSAGLNCGRWDYIFSCIKTCHRRNIFAMGGMAAQIPVKNNPKANEDAFAKVRADKEREATDGHDGTWVAHPGMVRLALDAFNRLMPTPNQIARKREDVNVSAKDLLDFAPSEPITEQGLRTNVSVGVQYLEAWMRGSGAVPIFNLMEDAATAEISRAQVWQWIRHPRGALDDGRKVTKELFRSVLDEELAKIETQMGEKRFADGKFDVARELFDRITTDDEFAEFLTLPGYEKLD